MSLEDVPQMIDLLKGGDRRATLSKTASFLKGASKLVSMMPRGRFDASKAGTPPDYVDLAQWVSHPKRPAGEQSIEDANHLAPAGVNLPPIEDRPCDCFWVVDTCFTQEICAPFVGDNICRRWNVPFNSKGGNEKTEKLCAKVLEMMQLRTAVGASCFNRTCRIYAPVYRQVSVLTFMHLASVARVAKNPEAARQLTRPEEAAKALDLAYNDVRRAFLQFLDDPATAGRPFVVAGHSQGSMHLLHLLQEEVEPFMARRQRFLHGYLTGWAVPMEVFQRTLRHIQPSKRRDDSCSISSWRTAANEHPDIRFLRASGHICDVGYISTLESELLANNPLSWSSGEEGSPTDESEFHGALWPLAEDKDPRDHESGLLTSGVGLRFGTLSAESQEPLNLKIRKLVEVDCGKMRARTGKLGMLRVSKVRKGSLFSLAERDWLLYHDLDCALFHNNLQENVALRVEAWQTNQSRL